MFNSIINIGIQLTVFVTVPILILFFIFTKWNYLFNTPYDKMPWIYRWFMQPLIQGIQLLTKGIQKIS